MRGRRLAFVHLSEGRNHRDTQISVMDGEDRECAGRRASEDREGPQQRTP